MIISDLELFLIELPSSEGPSNEVPLRSLVVHVISNSGTEGWGETRKAWRLSELPARRKALLAVLAGREAHDLAAILELDVLADRAARLRVGNGPVGFDRPGRPRSALPFCWEGNIAAVCH